MAATNQQVQTFANERVRPWSELMRSVYLLAKDHKANLGDVYDNLTNSPNWTDSRTDGPPHLLVPNDILAFNTFITDIIAAIEGNAQWPIIQKACVRPPGV